MIRTTPSPLLKVLLVAVAMAAVAACGSSSPEDVVDGNYESYATSDGNAPQANLTIIEDSVVLATGSETVETVITDSGEVFVVCPPDGDAQVRSIAESFTIGDIEFSSPGIFGDCGETKPVRVTIVDLDDVDPDTAFPFSDWVEFCDTDDPDC